jgi:DNA-binding NtrC family response regulator
MAECQTLPLTMKALWSGLYGTEPNDPLPPRTVSELKLKRPSELTAQDITSALAACNNNRTQAAKALGIAVNTLKARCGASASRRAVRVQATSAAPPHLGAGHREGGP